MEVEKGTTSYTTNALNQYAAVGGVTYVYDDNGNLTYDGGDMVYGYDPENRLTTVTNIEGQLSAACDVDLTFTTDSNAPWFLQTEEYYYDGDAVQSGDIDDTEETWLETTVTGSGYLRFRYKRSCEYGDEFTLFIDGQYRFGQSGAIDGSWTESGAWQITGSGTHTIRWRYSKNGSGSAGEDCVWVDYVRWSGTMPDAGAWGQIEYVYDPSGRRIEKKVDGDTELKFLYDGDHIIAEYDANDTLLRKYVHGPCIDEPICMIESSGTYAGTQYYHYDALGSVVALTDPNGDVVQLYEYSVYGQVAASDPNHPNRFMFTGREFDKDTGLYYYRARYYNPEIGRFLQTDPIGYGDGMNLYSYCGNNPLGFIDPSGCAMRLRVMFYDPTEIWYCESCQLGNDKKKCTDPADCGKAKMFTEAADDFADSLLELAIPMKSTDDVLKGLQTAVGYMAQLKKLFKCDIGLDVYFADHSHAKWDPATPQIATDVWALEFGDSVVSTKEDGANWGFWADLGAAVPAGTTLNFRHCFVAWDAYAQMNGEKEASLLEDLAVWTGHVVTGAISRVEYFHDEKKDGDIDIPDYRTGQYYQATPTTDGLGATIVAIRMTRRVY